MMPSQLDPMSIPTFPGPLRWHGTPQSWELTGGNVLTITAGPKSDWFIDPDNGQTVHNAPALLTAVHTPCMLKARVAANHRTTYDAAVLAVYSSDQVWAKPCLELSP